MQRANGEPDPRVGCEALDNGARAAAKFRLLRAGREIGTGACGKELPVAPGSYELAITLDGVLGAEERRVPVEARSGDSQRVRAEFETGELVVEVARDGRRSSGLVVLYRGGREVARTSAGVTTRLPTGGYTIEVESRGQRRRSETALARAERRVVQVAFGSQSAQPK